MSSEQPISILPVPEVAKTEEVAATDAVLAGPGPVVPAKDVEEKTTTTIKEETKQPSSPKERKPFGGLTNLFHRKASATSPIAPAEKENVKEETPIVKEEIKDVETETPVVDNTEVTSNEVESPKKKDGFLDKLKHALAGEKKEKVAKKSKEPEETKVDEAAPKLEEPVVEPEPKSEAPIAALVAPESTPAETPVEAPVVDETPKEVATEEVKKEEPVAAKKDKTKIGRRLSARITGIFTSPRKEKANPLDKSPAEEKKAEEALPAPVDLPKTEETKVEEPVVASTSTEPLPAVEGPKSTEPIKAEDIKVEEPTTSVTAIVTSDDATSKPEDRTPAIVS